MTQRMTISIMLLFLIMHALPEGLQWWQGAVAQVAQQPPHQPHRSAPQIPPPACLCAWPTSNKANGVMMWWTIPMEWQDYNSKWIDVCALNRNPQKQGFGQTSQRKEGRKERGLCEVAAREDAEFNVFIDNLAQGLWGGAVTCWEGWGKKKAREMKENRQDFADADINTQAHELIRTAAVMTGCL